MRALVIGAGAIGTLTAVRLAAAGEQVAIVLRGCSRSNATASARDTNGNVISVELPAYPSAGEAIEDFNPQLSIVAVKGYDTKSVIWDALGAGKPGGRRFLTLQNGVGNEETLAQAFGAENVISGAITIPVEKLAPLSVAQTRRGMIGMAPVRRGVDISDVLETFDRAGFEVRHFEDYRSMKWSKLIMNMVGNAIPAILDWPPEKVFGDKRLAELEIKALREAAAVMDAQGIRPVRLGGYPMPLFFFAVKKLPPRLLAAILKPMVAKGRGGKKPSLQLDLEGGKSRSEVGFLNGAVSRFGEEAGVPAPINRCISETLSSIFEGGVPWAEFKDDPEALSRRCAEYEQKEKTI